MRNVDEKKFRKLWDAGLSHEKIAEELGVYRSYINTLRQKLGLPARGKGKKPPAQDQAPAEKLHSYDEIGQIAQQEGVSLIRATQLFHQRRAQQ